MPNLDELNIFEKEEFLKHLKITWTYNSNAIEGNSLNYNETQFIIENGLTVKGKPLKEHNEVVGHTRAIDLIFDFIQKDIITQDDIFLLHKAVQTDVIIDIFCPIGEYKVEENGRMINVDNKLKYLPYPSPKNIPYLMKLWFNEFEKIQKIDTFDECVDIYTDMHISFTAIHPFFDGNGRMARLISNIPLLKSGFLPIIIDNTNRQEYIQLLSNYNLSSKELDKKSTNLIEKNEEYKKLKEFFQDQYKNSTNILEEIKRSKR
jgi:Fic family protein